MGRHICFLLAIPPGSLFLRPFVHNTVAVLMAVASLAAEPSPGEDHAAQRFTRHPFQLGKETEPIANGRAG